MARDATTTPTAMPAFAPVVRPSLLLLPAAGVAVDEEEGEEASNSEAVTLKQGALVVKSWSSTKVCGGLVHVSEYPK